jgi:hypothetical protein
MSQNPKTVKINWERNLRDEKELTALGTKFRHVANHPISRINVEASLRNNARFGLPVHPETVQEYAGFMEQGASFPVIVVFEATGIIAAGLHRLKAAMELGATTVDVCLITQASVDAIDTFTRSNNMGGIRPLSDDEKVQQAADMHLRKGRSIVDANRVVFGGRRNMTPQINAVVHQARVREALQVAGESLNKIELVTGKNPGSLSALYPLYPNKLGGGMGNAKLLSAAFNAVADNGLCAKDAADLVQEAKKHATEQEGIAAIKAYTATCRIKAAAPVGVDGTALRAGLSRLHKLFFGQPAGSKPIQSFQDLGITDPVEIQSILSRMRDVSRAVAALQPAHTPKVAKIKRKGR